MRRLLSCGRAFLNLSPCSGAPCSAPTAFLFLLPHNSCGMWVGKSFGNDPMLIATNEAFRYLSGLLHLRSHSQLPPGTRIQEQNAQERGPLNLSLRRGPRKRDSSER
ncbi:hypothetical protein NA56DRAFT_15937 [Hyaloscypha hepaticicola]|uniref:Uncharacterized protein n=1 Tax=Hyaloscypha hepaticicola TaxID=2082293 RepID=A0A2J6QQF9_9HELO|nr:hypothetical protein NA56DRAFT_15937 [Hyaloscypha hepaticicola]